MGILKKISSSIALSHSVFAMPFAVVSFVFAYKKGALVSFSSSFWYYFINMILAVFFARTAAMSFNRLVDRKIDARNPRTQDRELVTGELKIWHLSSTLIFSSFMFFLLADLIGFHCFVLSPFVLALLLFYSLSKRFTYFCHFILGMSLAAAPGGAWWILRPSFDLTPILIMLGVLFWVSGFDILYSCQDQDFDRENGLYSFPARFGLEKAFLVARLLHLVSVLMFFSVFFTYNLKSYYLIGVFIIALTLIFEHLIVSPRDLSKINRAFFTCNGIVSLVFCAFALFAL